MKLKTIGLIIFSGLVLMSCQKPTTNKVDTPKVETVKTDIKSAAKVNFSTFPNQVTKDEQIDLLFAVKNQNGDLIKDLRIAHEKLMHVMIVSTDLSEFFHVHPEIQNDGTFKIPYAFPNGGTYKIFIDITLADKTQVIDTAQLSVKGETEPAQKLIADDKFEQSTGGIKALMKPDGEFVAGKQMLLGFDVFDIVTKKPVTDLQNYLGEKGHFVIISENLEEFVHAHPISSTAKSTEHSEPSHDSKMPAANSESVVSAHVTFPKSGLYKLWAQFQRNGRVINVPFVIDVKENKELANKPTNVEIPKDAFKIIVSKDGFSPSEISFAAGKFSKLAFVRIDSENCADEISFKDLNITKKLPVGEVVLVDLPNSRKGNTLSFACGMNMFKGNLVFE
jgi:hypothetical protein